MGLLLEQNIPTLFQGVSRQPDSIRLPGQVEDALNVSFSVESGGVSKRNGTTILTAIPGAVGVDHKMHLISRSSVEKYAVMHRQFADTTGELKVFDLSDGTEKTVTIEDAADNTFFDVSPQQLEFLSVLDFTFVVDREQVVDMSPAPAPSTTTYAALQLTQANTDGVYSIEVQYTNPSTGNPQSFIGSATASNGDAEPDDQVNSVYNNLNASKPSGQGWVCAKDGSYVFIKNTQGIEFTLKTRDPIGDTGWKQTVNRVSETKDLVARSWRDHKVEIKKSTELEGYFLIFVPDDPDEDYGPGVWDETVPDGTPIDFDPSTMPRVLVRQSDGSFRLERVDWSSKTAGGPELVPNPDFVGRKISDIVFRANRLGFLSGETVFFSASGDYFRFWPDSATELVATDPFGLTNSTNQVSEFTFGVPFRRSLFIMSDEAQFEAFGDVFSPDQARIEVATQYPVNGNVRPVVLGDEMYFVSEIGNDVLLHSYVYNEDTVSEVANDVSKHVRGFIGGPVVQMAAGTLNGEIYILSDDDRSAIYTHKFFYEGRERVQSAWGRYQFEGGSVRSIGYVRGNLYLLIDRGGQLFLEYLPSVAGTTDEFELTPRLDRQQSLLGTYDPATNTTSWDVTHTYSNPVVLTTLLFPVGKQFLDLNVDQTGSVLTASGQWDQAEVLVGEDYDSFIIMSKQYLRDGQASITNGRLQLRTMTLRYEDSGYFEVTVEPDYRDVKTHTFTGRTLGSGNNQIQAFNLSSGRFRFMVNSNSETVRIKVGSDKYLPFTITSGAWIGFFNEISRQDNG